MGGFGIATPIFRMRIIGIGIEGCGYNRRMRRLAVFLLMLALPLQYSWAAVGAYCQHEGNAAQWHFGHHVHKHDEGDQKQKPGTLITHADCASCHYSHASMPLQCSSPLLCPAFAVHVPFDQQFLLTDVSSEPEKPNWVAAG